MSDRCVGTSGLASSLWLVHFLFGQQFLVKLAKKSSSRLTEIADDVTTSFQAEAKQFEDEIVFASDVEVREVDDKVEFQIIYVGAVFFLIKIEIKLAFFVIYSFNGP